MLGKHQCMQCGENEARVKLTKLAKGTIQELWLCQECAGRHSPYQKKLANLSIDAILAGILSQNKEEAARPGPKIDASCPTCGLPFDSYRSTLLLGCSDCYESFDRYLQSDLRKFHGAVQHTGRVPAHAPQPVERKRNPADLRKRLQDAVASEDYELAAKLRDEIARLTARVETL
jgi:protein arginine kinase activator